MFTTFVRVGHPSPDSKEYVAFMRNELGKTACFDEESLISRIKHHKKAGIEDYASPAALKALMDIQCKPMPDTIRTSPADCSHKLVIFAHTTDKTTDGDQVRVLVTCNECGMYLKGVILERKV